MPPIDGDGDTQLGGARRDFPSTCWSRLIGGPPEGPSRRAALEELARGYWKPVYAYIRAGWAKTNEDAKDLAQDFFVWMLDSDFLGRADPLRGRFRGFLKVALKHYLINEGDRRRAGKRGGDVRIVPLDDLVVDPEARPAGDPETALDDTWRSGLILRATALLEQALKSEGREPAFRIFRDFHLPGGDAAGYRALARAHGVSEQDVENGLRLAKKRFRAIMADLVAETVSSERELGEEWGALFGKGAP